MDNSKSSSSFHTGRKKTDRSLFAERDRTDRSLTRTRDEVETSTDVNLQKSRDEATQEQSLSRQATDTEDRRELKGPDSSPAPEGDQPGGNASLVQERERADQVTERERARTDAAINRERELKQDLVRKLVGQERAQTDLNLEGERQQTDDEVTRVTGLLSDEVIAHSKAKIALTTRDEFLAIVSHDLRNPIGAIFSCTEMLLEDATYSEMDSETKHWIEFIKRNAETALHLISDILDIERIAEGKLALRFGQHNVSRMIRESMENFIHVASAKNILLRSKSTCEIGDATCDRDRIMQVLGNLIGNAIKFTPEGGSVVLDARLENDVVLVSVCDTGPGIPDEKKAKIFERFAQIGSKDRRGLGLGLYISKMLIDAHQGKIWVDSEVGKGSTFWIEIPVLGPSSRSDFH